MTINIAEMLKQLKKDYAQSEEAAVLLSKAVGEKVNSGHIRRLVKSDKLVAVVVSKRLHIERTSIIALAKSGWKPGDKPDADRTYVCYNIWLTRADVASELKSISRVLDREVRAHQRKYYHAKKAK